MEARRTRFKICGLRTDEDLAGALEAGPDYVGFIFVPGRRRFAEPEQVHRMLASAKANGRLGCCQPVGVFLDAEIPWVMQVLETVPEIETVQLHGHKDEAYLKALREAGRKIGRELTVIQAFSVSGEADLVRVRESSADLCLIDGKCAGSGQAFDWSVLSGLERPFLLAGGIGPDNAAAAMEQVRPYGLDASSLLESGGVKDGGKMRAFAEAIRCADERCTERKIT